MIQFLFAVFLLLFASSASATTYYVKSSCTNNITTYNAGADTCTGGAARVYSSIVNAFAGGLITAGDTIDVRAGTYNTALSGDSNIPAGLSGTAGNPITLQGHTGETVTTSCIGFSTGTTHSYWVIDNIQMVETNSASGNDCFYLGDGGGVHHMTLTNSSITNASRLGIHILSGSHHNLFDKVEVTGSGTQLDPHSNYGLYVEGSNNTFTQMKVHDNRGYGFHIYHTGGSSVSNNIITSSLIYANGGSESGQWGVLMADGTNNQITNSVIYGNTAGIDVDYNCTNCIVYNNTVYQNTLTSPNGCAGCPGIMVGFGTTASGTVVKNNIVYLNNAGGFLDNGTSTTWQYNLCGDGACNLGTNNQTGNPLFVNAGSGNFSLQASSPAIDVGTSSIASGVTACANGSAPDIGAIETLGTPTATVNGTAAIITIPNNCTSQMLPASSVTGWTFKKNGSGDTVTANSLSGTNSYAATLTSAFIGGDTCLFSYSQSGNSVSNNNIGNVSTSNQEVLAFTDTACTNITAGGGPTLAYTHGRWYLLQGATDTAWIPKAAADTNVTVAPGSKLNLRWKVKNTGGDTSLNPRIRVAYDGGSYVELTSSYVNAVKALGSAPQLGTVMTDASPMTQDQLTSDVANIACTYIRNPVSAPNLALTTNTESECGAAIDFDTTAVVGKQYDFKLYDDVGTAVSGGPISVIIGGYSSVR